MAKPSLPIGRRPPRRRKKTTTDAARSLAEDRKRRPRVTRLVLREPVLIPMTKEEEDAAIDAIAHVLVIRLEQRRMAEAATADAEH